MGTFTGDSILKLLEKAESNTWRCDGMPCTLCGKIPPATTRPATKGRGSGPDRSARIDANDGRNDITYCKSCWYKLVYTNTTSDEIYEEYQYVISGQ